MKGFTKDDKFHPIQEQNGVRKSRDQTAKTEGIRIRKKSAIEQKDVLDNSIMKLQKSLKEGLDSHFKNNPRFKNAVWDVDVTYEGAHGTVDSEYFRITAFREGVGSVEYREAFSNDDWFDSDDKRRVKKIENDRDFADREYSKWLAETLEVYEDAMFEGLVATIEDEWAE